MAGLSVPLVDVKVQVIASVALALTYGFDARFVSLRGHDTVAKAFFGNLIK